MTGVGSFDMRFAIQTKKDIHERMLYGKRQSKELMAGRFSLGSGTLLPRQSLKALVNTQLIQLTN